MIPSSSNSNSSNQLPIRRSGRRERNISSNIADSNRLELNSFDIVTSYFFSKRKKQILSIFRLEMRKKAEMCLSLIRNFFNCVINELPSSIYTPEKLLIKTASILDKTSLPSVFLSLFTTNILADYIEKQNSKKTTALVKEKECHCDRFFILIDSMFDMICYVQKSVSKFDEQLETKNHYSHNIDYSFERTAAYIFKNKNIKESKERKTLISIIVSASSPLNNKSAYIAQKLMLEHSLNNINELMQAITNQVCYFFIKNRMDAPLCGNDIFSFIKRYTSKKLYDFTPAVNLTIWIRCIFLSISNIFFKGTPNKIYANDFNLIKKVYEHFPNIVKSHTTMFKRLKLLIKKMSNILIKNKTTETNKNNFPNKFSLAFELQNSLEFTCGNLNNEFIELTKLLHILLESIDQNIGPEKGSASAQTKVKCILKQFEKSFFREILVVCLKQFESIKTSRILDASQPIDPSGFSCQETSSSPIPKRKSIKRPRLKMSFLFGQSTKTIKKQSNIEKVPISTTSITKQSTQGMSTSSSFMIRNPEIKIQSSSTINISKTKTPKSEVVIPKNELHAIISNYFSINKEKESKYLQSSFSLEASSMGKGVPENDKIFDYKTFFLERPTQITAMETSSRTTSITETEQVNICTSQIIQTKSNPEFIYHKSSRKRTLSILESTIPVKKTVLESPIINTDTIETCNALVAAPDDIIANECQETPLNALHPTITLEDAFLNIDCPENQEVFDWTSFLANP